MSPSQVAALSAQLGNPTYDPHGDPIPTAGGEFVKSEGQPLTDVRPGEPMRIVHLEDEPDAVYRQIVAEGLYPGMGLRVLEKDHERIRFWADGEEHVLAPSIAGNISVVPVPAAQVEEMPAAARLSSLKLGEKARILGVSRASRGNERRRLLDLGFVPGTVVEVAMVSPVNDPTAYRVRGTLIALRRDQANMIQVASPEEAAK